MTAVTPEAPPRSAPHPSVRMRRDTRQKAERRERQRLKQYRERMAFLMGGGRSDRSRFTARMREVGADQVTLDKLNGLELGRIARAAYRETRRPPDPPRVKHRGKPRPWDTYRAAKRLLARGKHNALVFKAQRKVTGETRSEADRRRQQAAQSAA